MAWSTPLTAVSNATLTAAQWNASVRDNLLETAPAKATAAGQWFVGTGANSIAARGIGFDRVDTSESTSSTSYGDLATIGPRVSSLTTGTGAIVWFSAQITNNTAGSGAIACVDVSGASTVSFGDAVSITHEPGSANADTTCARVQYYVLTAGSNTFTTKYRALANTATFLRRTLVVFPL